MQCLLKVKIVLLRAFVTSVFTLCRARRYFPKNSSYSSLTCKQKVSMAAPYSR